MTAGPGSEILLARSQKWNFGFAQLTDATGRVWQTGYIYTTGALASIYTQIFASVLGFIKIARMEKTFDA
jgi:hypothetical protein